MRITGKRFLFFTFALFFSHHFLLCVDIGSDTSVTRFETRQTLNNGDRVAGFAALEAGFKFGSIGVSALWDSFFPVSGDVGLSRGILTLDRDFIFHDIATVKELGDIVGNFHTIEFSSSITCIPSVDTVDDTFFIQLVDREGQVDDVESADWSFDGKFVAEGLGEKVTGHDVLRIYEFDGVELTLKDSDLSVDIYSEVPSVRWHPSEYLLAVCLLNVSGEDFLMYEVNSVTGALTYKDGLFLGGDSYAVEWHPTGNWVVIGKQPGSTGNEIDLHAVDSSGNITTTPVASINISPSRTVQTQAIRWDSAGDHLVIGINTDGVNPELLVYEFNQITPGFTFNASKTIGKTVRSIAWNKNYTNFIAVGLQETSGELLQIYEHNSGSGTITKRDSKSDINAYVRGLDWNPNGDILGVARNATSGNDLKFYGFDPADSYLTEEIIGFEYADQVESVKWSPSGFYIAVGSDSNLLDIYELRSGEIGCVTFYDVNIFLNQDLYLKQECLHFSGESMISGRGNCLTLAPTCTIFIDSDSTVFFKDITIKGLNGRKIQCEDSSTTVSFHDCQWVQDGDFTFEAGKIDVLKDWSLVGEGHTFVYQTDQISTVSTYGRLIVENNMTFRYDPSISSKDLICLLENSSEIILNGGTLHSTEKGMDLKTGRLIVDRESVLLSDGTEESEALNLSLANGLTYQELPAANIDFYGYVVIE